MNKLTFSYQKAVIGLFVFMIMIAVSACGLREEKTPEQWFNFTWSGLAGCDSLSFQGLAALQRGDEAAKKENISYTGRLNNHRELSIQTVIPQNPSSGRVRTAEAGAFSKSKFKLRWERGGWRLQSNENDMMVRGLTRLNPLHQLEEIKGTSKTITAESGAARGTKVLRIVLNPSEATLRMKDRLLEEMSSLGFGLENKLQKVDASRQDIVEKELNTLWTSGNAKLQKMLEQMNANVVYHLTIDRKTGLPARLTSETTVDYVTFQGASKHEVLYTDTRFDGYR
ncbi:hypothetical protein ACFQ3W_07535 [Paenibacillus puldeungensis]|uniref:Lipoprotein n=1 Tax=Paenibacillus puldeungensis TaxID=696536 RepID=A0ABW3RV20_9BACL